MEQSLIDKAIVFASKKHEGTKRKGTGQPYVFHPLEVLSLASMISNDEDILVAAVLHDVLEDTNATKEEIEKEFNKRVLELVTNETEDKRGNVNKAATWQVRKQEAIDIVRTSKDIGTKIICLCDKVSNLRSFHLLQLQEGDKMWEHFNAKDPKMHYWYYNSLKDALKELEYTGIYKEYCFLVQTIFEGYI